MSNWADTVQDEELNQRPASEASYNELEEYVDTRALWANAKTVVRHETDADGNTYLVTLKVRSYPVDRHVTMADLRAKLPHFGKGTGDQSHFVSAEPSMALELGAVDEWERDTRGEVKRMINEVANINVVVKDEHLRKVREEETKRGKDVVPSSSGGGNTWRNVASKSNDTREEATTGIRIRNLSDDITQENLTTIFEGFGWDTKTVRIPRGDTNQSRGFAFVDFREAWMADAAIEKGVLKFKNVVLTVSRAETRTNTR